MTFQGRSQLPPRGRGVGEDVEIGFQPWIYPLLLCEPGQAL